MAIPIKYSIEELKVAGGPEHLYEDVTVGFIVSKCYVLESRLCYGSFPKVKYVVSFPYDKFDIFVNWFKHNSHNYNYDIFRHYHEDRRNYTREYLRDGGPPHIVHELFDNYFDAKEAADVKNSHFRSEQLSTANSALYEKLISKFNNDALVCAEYEKFIFANTSDMEVDSDISFDDFWIPRTCNMDEEIASLIETFELDSSKRQEIISNYKMLKKEKLIRKK